MPKYTNKTDKFISLTYDQLTLEPYDTSITKYFYPELVNTNQLSEDDIKPYISPIAKSLIINLNKSNNNKKYVLDLTNLSENYTIDQYNWRYSSSKIVITVLSVVGSNIIKLKFNNDTDTNEEQIIDNVLVSNTMYIPAGATIELNNRGVIKHLIFELYDNKSTSAQILVNIYNVFSELLI